MLFGDDPDEVTPPAVAGPGPVADWQVELLRNALDARGLDAMADRRSLLQETVGRPVESLRALTSDEALSVLSHLGSSSRATGSAASTWDDRDEDTWIDRL